MSRYLLLINFGIIMPSPNISAQHLKGLQSGAKAPAFDL
jgi:hypothetical protein